MSSEKNLNYKRIASELQQFVTVLKQQLPYSAYAKLLEETNNFNQADKLYLYLMRISKEYNLNVSRNFPRLDDFFTYIDLSRKVNPVELVGEEKRLVNEINFKLAQNQGQRDAAFLLCYFNYFEEYFANKISAEDYGYFVANLPKFKGLWVKYAENDRLAALDPYFSLLNEFYKVNIERNGSFVKNMLGAGAAGQTKPQDAYLDDLSRTVESLKDAEEVKVVVTGGFHTEGLKKIFNEKGISYIIVTPNVTQDTKLSDLVYLKLAKEQSKIAFQAFALLALANQPDNLKAKKK